MIETGYFAQIKNYPETDWLICISLKYPWFVKKEKMSHMPSLAPSQELLDDWKSGSITWNEYEDRYKHKILETVSAHRNIMWIGLKDAQGETVRLMCWEKNPPCHRFILKDLIHLNGGKTENDF